MAATAHAIMAVRRAWLWRAPSRDSELAAGTCRHDQAHRNSPPFLLCLLAACGNRVRW
jgi:hypothetical protein